MTHMLSRNQGLLDMSSLGYFSFCNLKKTVKRSRTGSRYIIQNEVGKEGRRFLDHAK